MPADQQQQQQSSTSRRRRSSGPSYDSLMNHKRSADPTSMARRASLSEQKPHLGFFGSMWHKETRPAQPRVPVGQGIILNNTQDLFPHQSFPHASGAAFPHVNPKGLFLWKVAERKSAWGGFSSAESETLAPEQSSFCRGAVTLWHITLTIALISFRKNPRYGGHSSCPPTQ
ncbi:hypothetical protein F5Y09DRAFT_335995 [Xylaria sp. FL1042]|nr:hypothetical protein F5Y09DRAFT_335995 [Xylaria sp. FL1042]